MFIFNTSGVGFKVRGNSNIDWLVLQLHYGDLPDNNEQFIGNTLLINRIIDINHKQDHWMASPYSWLVVPGNHWLEYTFLQLMHSSPSPQQLMVCYYCVVSILHVILLLWLCHVVVNLDLACQYFGNTIVPFAYRVHAHSLGGWG